MGYITPTVRGVRNASHWGTKLVMAHTTSGWIGYISPAVRWGPQRFTLGARISNGPQVGRLATSRVPLRGGPERFTLGDKVSNGPQMGGLATSPLPLGRVPNTSHWGTKSVMAHKWADWLHHPCRQGGVPNA